MPDVDLVCYEDIGDIPERQTNVINVFSDAFRCNDVISLISVVDEYIVAGAFIILVRRSTMSPSEYHLWILQAVIISWYTLEESFELTYQIERIYGNVASDECHRKAMLLSEKIDWNTFIEIDEIEEAVSLLRFICKDILRTRSSIPNPVVYV